jgi:hypothetical protein
MFLNNSCQNSIKWVNDTHLMECSMP